MSYSFTRNEIHRVAPISGGVYRIFNDRSNIYVLVFKLREKSQSKESQESQDELPIAAEAALLHHLNKLHENGSYQIPGNYPANGDPKNSRNTH